MDLLLEIRSKLLTLDGHASQEGIRAAIRHIEVAERWFDRGRTEQDEDLFNDVIYRANQAFEGMLKEAYRVLTGEDYKKLSSYQIEKHLLEKDVFTPRLLELFKNYRQEWRNPSTHDHSLFFNEQEALLAIVRVSAFATILLDQIIEAVNFQLGRMGFEQRKKKYGLEIPVQDSASLYDDMLVILELFDEEMGQGNDKGMGLREIELLGRLSGFIESFDSSIRIIREPIISENSGIRPDLVLERKNEKLIVELKRIGLRPSNIQSGKAQMLSYLKASGFEHGILFIPSFDPMHKIEVKTEKVDLNDRVVYVHTVASSHTA